MAYRDFSLLKFKQAFGYTSSFSRLFEQEKITTVKPSERLLEDLREAETLPMMTEKAKSELVIMPIIKELKRNHKQLNVFSGFYFNVDANLGLTGIPDFILARAVQNLIEIEAPIFCLVEAKNGILEEGIGQCAAEMHAARLFNRQMNDPCDTIFGVVTNAFDWVFLKLDGDTIYIDQERYFLNDLPRLLGVMDFILKQYIL